MKKFFVLFCSAVLALSLVACNVNSGSSVNPDNSVDKPTTPEEPTTPDVPETPAQPETPVIPQKELCDVCGVEHYKTDKYHFDTRDDIFDWTDEEIKRVFNPLGEDETSGGGALTGHIFFCQENPQYTKDENAPIAYYTGAPYQNSNTLIIPRMYKNIPVRGFVSMIANRYIWNDGSGYDEPEIDVRKIYIHKDVNYCNYPIGGFGNSIDDMQLFYEGTQEEFKSTWEENKEYMGQGTISGVVHTLLDGKTIKFDGFRLLD